MGFSKKWTAEADDHILALGWTGNTLVVTPSTGAPLVVNEQGEVREKLASHGLGNGATAVRDGSIVTCGFDGKLRFYGSDLKQVREVVLGKGWIERAKWSPDGKHLAAALGKTLFILNEEGETVASFPNHQTSVADFIWNPANPQEIATVGGGGARMWRLSDSVPYAKFDWGGASLLAAWSPDGRWIVTGDQTPSVHLYDFTRDYPLHIQGYEAKVKTMDFSPDGKKLATGGGPVVTVWDCTGKTGPENTTPGQLRFHKGDVEAIAWSPEGEILATGDLAGRIVFSDPKGKPISAFQDEAEIASLAWRADGGMLAAGDAAGQVVAFTR